MWVVRRPGCWACAKGLIGSRLYLLYRPVGLASNGRAPRRVRRVSRWLWFMFGRQKERGAAGQRRAARTGRGRLETFAEANIETRGGRHRQSCTDTDRCLVRARIGKRLSERSRDRDTFACRNLGGE